MLELLADYARKHKLPGLGFKPKTVRWVIVCDLQGRLLDVVELGDVGQKKNRGQEFPLCPDLSAAEMNVGGTVKSHFLLDTAEVVALYGDNARAEKVAAKHEYFSSLLRDAGMEIPELVPLSRLLADDVQVAALRDRLAALKVNPTAKVTFQVGGMFPIETDCWHNWWQAFRQSLAPDDEAPGRPMVCFVTGATAKAARTHPSVDGLRDVGGSMGPVLVGFDKDAFTSYGLEQSANAAVSEEAAHAYRAALNDLIARHSQKLAGAKVAHWFKCEVRPEDDPLAWLSVGEEEQEPIAQHRASELLQSIREGRRPDLAGNYYYAITLSGAGGRVMVRDWMEGQFEDLASNIDRWFGDLSIVHRDGGRTARDPKFLAVMGATVRDLKDLPPPFAAKMWRVAVRREPIPQTALAQALARVKVDIIGDEPFSHARMGLMKAYHIRSSREDGGYMKPYLNEEHPAPAYHCGRMMAMLAKLQQAALGNVGASVVQRYYAAASSTPALVLGRLVRGGQFHLNKLDPGLAHWYEEKLGSIAARLGDSVPQTLTLEEQSLFALGYYQQLAFRKSDDADAKEETHE